jgi:hypothetical protein
MKRAFASAACAAILAVSARAGAGEPTAEESAQSEMLFRDGRALVSEGRVAEACAKFAESYRLDPKPGALINLAACHAQQGKTASAWVEYNEAAAAAARAGQDRRAQVARDSARALESKLSRIALDVGAPASNETVTLDDHEVAPASFGTPLPVDPGVHRVAATTPGKTPWATQVEIPAGPGDHTIRVPPLDDARAAPPAPAPMPTLTQGSSGTLAQREEPRTGGSGGVPAMTYVFGAVAIAGGAAFTVLWLSAVSDADAIRATCANGCASPNLDPLRTKVLIADISLGVGSAAALAAVGSYVLRLKGDRATTSVGVAPAPGGVIASWRLQL